MFEFFVIMNVCVLCEVSKFIKLAFRDLSSYVRRNFAGSSSRKFFGSGDVLVFVVYIVWLKFKKM